MVAASGSQAIVVSSSVLFKIIGIFNLLVKIITELRVEILRRKLKLKFQRSKIFRDRKKEFVFTYLGFKKKEFRVRSRTFLLRYDYVILFNIYI